MVMTPRNASELRRCLSMMRMIQPGYGPHSVVLFGDTNQGDFRGAIARSLLSCIPWAGIRCLVWKTISTGPLANLSESSVCCFLTGLRETGVRLQELCFNVHGLPMSDTFAKHLCALIRSCHESLLHCSLSFRGNTKMSHDAIMEVVNAMAFCKMRLRTVRLDTHGMFFPVGIFSAIMLATLLVIPHVNELKPGYCIVACTILLPPGHGCAACAFDAIQLCPVCFDSLF